MKLAYAIKYVADMNRAVKFYRDVLGLQLKFESPEWSEFATGETTLALHPATAKHSAGAVELGFTVTDIQNSHKDLGAKGVRFSISRYLHAVCGKVTLDSAEYAGNWENTTDCNVRSFRLS